MIYHRRDGLFSAHKAAEPEKYSVREEVRKLCPALDGIETRYGGTEVHLQVYDGENHLSHLNVHLGNSERYRCRPHTSYAV